MLQKFKFLAFTGILYYWCFFRRQNCGIIIFHILLFVLSGTVSDEKFPETSENLSETRYK